MNPGASGEWPAQWLLNGYAGLLFLGALLNSALALFVWRQRSLASNRSFFWLVVTVALWLWSAGASIVSGSEAAATFWGTYVRFHLVLFGPYAYFCFVLDYTGHLEWLSPKRLALILCVPAVGVLLLWTAPWHELLVYGSSYERVGNVMLRTAWSRGPWFWVFVVSSYSLVVIGIGLLMRRVGTTRSPEREQALTVLLICLLPFVGSIPPTFRLSPPWLDPVALTFAATVLLVGWALARYELLDLMPLARDAVVENLEDGVLVSDARGRVVDVNSAMRHVLAADGGPEGRSSWIGRPLAEVAGGSLLAELTESGSGTREVSLGLAPSLSFDLQVTPLDRRGGTTVGHVFVLRDVTEQRWAERELSRHAADLEATNADLDTYARTVAHDLKSPLVTISGHAGLLEQDVAAGRLERLGETTATIRGAARRMGEIIDALLLMARVREADIELQTLDMGAVAERARTRLADAIGASGARVVTTGALPAALGHGGWVEEVWVNYLSNALKYGGRPPAVELGAEPGAESMVRFWVRDNGPGLSAEETSRLFMPFSRLVGRSVEGHGLGLSIVRRIVEKLGGEAGVESQPGAGCTFYFTLRAA